MPGQKNPEHARREQILNAALQVALREGIARVTVRAVAAEAGVSHALVLFHFERKDTLVRELLATVLAQVLPVPVVPDVLPKPGSSDRVRALIHEEIARLGAEPARVYLLLDAWALGARHSALREQVSVAWSAYRSGFRVAIEQALSEAGPLVDGVTADGLASLIVGIVSQCVVQEVIDPAGFATTEHVGAAEAAISGLFGGAREQVD